MKTKLKLKIHTNTPNESQSIVNEKIGYVTKGINEIKYVTKSIYDGFCSSCSKSLQTVTSGDIQNISKFYAIKNIDPDANLHYQSKVVESQPGTLGYIIKGGEPQFLSYETKEGESIYAFSVKDMLFIPKGIEFTGADREYLQRSGIQRYVNTQTGQVTSVVPVRPIEQSV